MIIIIAHTSTRAGVLVCIILSSSAATAGCAITIFPHFLFHFSFLFTMSLSLSLSPFCAAWVSFFSNPKSSIRQSWKRKEKKKISCPYFGVTCVTLLRTSQMMRERGYARNIYLLDDFHMIMHGRRRRRVSIRWRRRNPPRKEAQIVYYVYTSSSS